MLNDVLWTCSSICDVGNGDWCSMGDVRRDVGDGDWCRAPDMPDLVKVGVSAVGHRISVNQKL